MRLTDPLPKVSRPERLRLRSAVGDSMGGPQVTVIRQPRGPVEDQPVSKLKGFLSYDGD